MQAAADRRISLFFLSFFYNDFRYHDKRSSFKSNYSEGWLHVPSELRANRSSFFQILSLYYKGAGILVHSCVR